MTSLLHTFNDNPYMWDGFAGAEHWSEDLSPLFATIEYANGDGCILVTDKKGIQVFFEDWNDYDGEAWSLNLEDASHEFLLALSEGMAFYLTELASRMEASTFLARAGFTIV